MLTAPYTLTLTAAAEHIRARQLSPVDLVRRALLERLTRTSLCSKQRQQSHTVTLIRNTQHSTVHRCKT